MNRGESVRRIEQEIRRAKAEALGRTGERLEAALGVLADLDGRLDRLVASLAVDAGARPRVAETLEARNRLRDEAARLRQQLVIQREAIGVFRHGPVAERYPVPPRRRFPADSSATWPSRPPGSLEDGTRGAAIDGGERPFESPRRSP